jgi:hypothetical protein
MTSLTNSYAADGLVAPLFFTRPPYHPFNPEERGLVEAPVTVLALPLPKVLRGPPKEEGGVLSSVSQPSEKKIFPPIRDVSENSVPTPVVPMAGVNGTPPVPFRTSLR